MAEHDIRTYYVTLSNDLGRRYKGDRLSVVQMKFLAVLISRIVGEELPWLTIDLNVFKKAMHISESSEKIVEEVLKLETITFEIIGSEQEYHWLKGLYFDGSFHARLDESIRDLVTGLENRYYQYLLGMVCQLKKTYSMQLYNFLRSWAGKSFARISIGDLVPLLGCSYVRPIDLERRVLDPAISEINEYTDIEVSYNRDERKALYSERSVVFGYNFTITNKESYEIDDMLSCAGVHDEEIAAFHDRVSFGKSTKTKVSKQKDSSEKMTAPGWKDHPSELKEPKRSTGYYRSPYDFYRGDSCDLDAILSAGLTTVGDYDDDDLNDDDDELF